MNESDHNGKSVIPGALYLVATPIGNLEDITIRALNILRDSDRILAEDTRHTGVLLAHYSIKTLQTSYHEHNKRSRLPVILDWLPPAVLAAADLRSRLFCPKRSKKGIGSFRSLSQKPGR